MTCQCERCDKPLTLMDAMILGLMTTTDGDGKTNGQLLCPTCATAKVPA